MKMPNNPYYVFDEKLCKVEGMTKEQIINAIAQATGVTPSDVDAGFISTLIENNKSRSIHFWKGTQAQFNALESYDANTFYIIDDDSTIADHEAAIAELNSNISDIGESVSEIAEDVSDLQEAVGSDTGWLAITATNSSSQTVTIGHYRVIGKIAFFDFDVDVSAFSSDTFTLPIQLDLSSSGATFIFDAYDSQSAQDVHSHGYATVTATQITFEADENFDDAMLSFSYPVAATTE